MVSVTNDPRDELRAQLDHLLQEQLPGIGLYSNYYDGNHRLQFATSKFREAFGELFEAFATNWCGLVVDVAVDRLKIQGFRFGTDDADEDAKNIWQFNNLDALSAQAHTEAVKCGTAYLLVGPPPEPGAEPRITVEHPAQCYVLLDPADRTKRLAGIKKYTAKNGDIVAVIYEPDLITTYVKRSAFQTAEAFGLILPAGMSDWDTKSQVKNVLGEVPLIPLANAPNLLTGGTSDLKPAVKLNDAANKFFTDMIHASEFTSFPQRILTGVELPRDPVTGEVLDSEELRAAVSRLWVFEGDNAKAHQLAVGDLGNYVEGVDMAVQHLAAQTRTPPHYLLAKLANISGEALITAEVGLVARCKRKHLDFSDAWEDAMRLAFKWKSIHADLRDETAGDASTFLERSQMFDAETIWADPERIAPSTLADAVIKEQAAGVPWEKRMEKLGYSPQEIDRMREQRLREQQEELELELEKKRQTDELDVDKAEKMAKALPAPKAPAKAPAKSNGR
jgi:hypothetical protein